jgi:hypothetical protein
MARRSPASLRQRGLATGDLPGLPGVIDEAAVGEGDDAVGDPAELALVGDEHDGLAVARERAEEVEHRAGGARVEVAGGLVGDDDRRVVGERAGDRGALLLAARERRRQLVGLIGDADAVEQLEGACASAVGRLSPSAPTSAPATRTLPAVGRSMPAIRLIRVDLPLPELPTTAISSPDATRRSRSASANSSPSGVW